jgi:Calcium-dependent channel, 7TM region, putative phosphate
MRLHVVCCDLCQHCVCAIRRLVGMTYVVIVPVIEPAVAVYFGLAYLVWKHQALNVYSQQSEGGGNIYVQVEPSLFANSFTLYKYILHLQLYYSPSVCTSMRTATASTLPPP